MVKLFLEEFGTEHEARIKKIIHNEYNKSRSRYKDLSVSISGMALTPFYFAVRLLSYSFEREAEDQHHGTYEGAS